jgi:uncharacterized protein with PQ loop repeat
METSLPTIAGFVSTMLFTLGTLPMLSKAFRTKNLASYSLGNILLSNIGNLIYSIYVFQLPRGPIWFLHSYYLLSTGLMLIWYLRYEGLPPRLRSFGWQAITRVPSLRCCFSLG